MKFTIAAVAIVSALCYLPEVKAQDDWQDTSGETEVYTHKLTLNDEKMFNIIQLGDLLHDGGDFSATETLIKHLISAINPQLIVITGDTVDPSKSRDWEKLHKEAMNYIVKSDIPWMWTGGQNVNGLSRDQMLGIDQQLSFKNSWSGYKWDTLTQNAKFSDE